MSARSHTLGKSFIDPRSLVFWVFAGVIVYGAIHVYPILMASITLYPSAGLLSALLWAVYGLLLAVILYKLELFERRSPLTLVGAFLWGSLAVAGLGVTASVAASDLVGKLLGPDLQDWIPAISAPLVEEPLKMLGIVALAFIPSARINSPLDGLFYGLIVGLGFEVTESLLYTNQAAAAEGGAFITVVLMFVMRGVVGGLWNHPTYSGITGAGVGYFFGSEKGAGRRWAVMLGSLLAAMVLHGFFDSPLFEGNVLVGTVVKGLPALVLLLVLLRMARNKDRRTFDRIGSAEVPAELISESELKTLGSKSSRRHARKAVKKESGVAAGHALRHLQRDQIDLVETIVDEGTGSPRTQEAISAVQKSRDVLAQAKAQR